MPRLWSPALQILRPRTPRCRWRRVDRAAAALEWGSGTGAAEIPVSLCIHRSCVIFTHGGGLGVCGARDGGEEEMKETKENTGEE